MRVALLDGDILVYESASKTQTTFDWGDGSVPFVDPAVAISNFEKRLHTILSVARADAFIIALSDPSRTYWRHAIDPTYKAGRGSTERPLALSLLREHAEAHHPTYVRPALEADDVMGILATGQFLQRKYKRKTVEPVVVTSDKDLKQIPGLHLNPQKLDEGMFSVTEEEGDAWHLTQTLTGDATDGYPGCPGIGPVKAKAYVSKGWEGVLEAFEKKGLGSEEALKQARLARILRAGDWDAKRKEVILWQPTQR